MTTCSQELRGDDPHLIHITCKHVWGEILVPFILLGLREVRNHRFRSVDDGTFMVPEDTDLSSCTIIVFDRERKKDTTASYPLLSCPWLNTMVIITQFTQKPIDLNKDSDNFDTY